MYHLSYRRRFSRRGGLHVAAAQSPDVGRRKLIMLLLMLLILALFLAFTPADSEAATTAGGTPALLQLHATLTHKALRSVSATPAPPRLPAMPAPDRSTFKVRPAPDPKTQDYAACKARNNTTGACRQFGPFRQSKTFKPRW